MAEVRYRGRGESIATNMDAQSVYSVSTATVIPSPLRSRSRSRDRPIDRPAQPTYERNRQNRYEHPKNFIECYVCGKRHPGGGRECQFMQHKESETFKRLQSVSQSIKSLEYGRKLQRVGRDS